MKFVFRKIDALGFCVETSKAKELNFEAPNLGDFILHSGCFYKVVKVTILRNITCIDFSL